MINIKNRLIYKESDSYLLFIHKLYLLLFCIHYSTYALGRGFDVVQRAEKLQTQVNNKTRLKKKLGKCLEWPIHGWENVCVSWYGGQIKQLSVTEKNCFWLAGKKSQIISLKLYG